MNEWLDRALARKAGLLPPAPPLVPPVALIPPKPPLVPPSYLLNDPAPPLSQTALVPPQGDVQFEWLAQVKAQALARGGDAVLSTVDKELLRILSLPMIQPTMARCPDRAAYAKGLINHAAPAGFNLRDVQIDSVYTYEMYGGLLGPQGVGWGKTLTTLLCAKIGLQRRGHERVLLTVPSEVFSQLTQTDLPNARRWLALDGIPFWIVSGSAQKRMDIARQPGTGVWIYSYSSISTKTGHEEMLAINPTLYVSDEAHYLANAKSARTRRWSSVIGGVQKLINAKKGSPTLKATGVECVALSGTITKKSVDDYGHLAEWALGDNSPVPINYLAMQLFTAMIDADVKGTALTDRDYERMQRLIDWAKLNGLDVYEEGIKKGTHLTTQEATRDAFHHRLRSAPGVVSTSDAGVDCSLIISWSEPPRPVDTESEKMVELMTKVVEEMITPDGDSIDFGMHTYKWLWELTAGFYNSLIWPDIGWLRKQSAEGDKPISDAEAGALLEGALNHNRLLQLYHKELRTYLDHRHAPGCDTPMLVAKEIVSQLEGKAPKVNLPAKLIGTYKAQKQVFYDDLPKRKSTPIRICDYKIRGVVEWCRAYQKEGGLIWYHHPAVGEWISEYLTVAGIPHTCAKAGEDKKAYLPGLVVASYAHATGKNLQHQSRNLVVELRREADKMEQMLGRTHRSGQKSDDVRVDVLISNGFDLALFNAILRDSDYIQSTTGMMQRLCYATYSPVVPTMSPRLAVRLGIVSPQEAVRALAVPAYQTISDPETLSLTDVFRSTQYRATAPSAPLIPPLVPPLIPPA